jgi:predicted nucleic acid-binding protein
MRVAVDSSIFIYASQNHEEFGSNARRILNNINSGVHNGVASVLCFSEVLGKPIAVSKELGLKEQLLMEGLSHIDYIKADEEIAILSAHLRAKYGAKLKLADSLHLATAIKWGARVFITNDRELTEIKIKDLDIKLLVDCADL